jgi:hypothetical protein
MKVAVGVAERGSVKFIVQYFIRAVLSRLPALSRPLNYSPPVSAWLGRHRMGVILLLLWCISTGG